MKRVFIIHGWEGNPNSNWQPWLKNELIKKGYEVVAPQMPNPNEPQCKDWVNSLNKLVGTPTSSDYFVGHSLAVIAILRYFEQLKIGQEVGGAVLVSGFPDSLGIEQHHGFFDGPVNWESVKSHCKNFVVLQSDNDPYVPMSHGKKLKENLGANLIIKHNAGHISKDAGFVELPEALNAILGFPI